MKRLLNVISLKRKINLKCQFNQLDQLNRFYITLSRTFLTKITPSFSTITIAVLYFLLHICVLLKLINLLNSTHTYNSLSKLYH